VEQVLAAAVAECRTPTSTEIRKVARVLQRERTIEKQARRTHWELQLASATL
jgi:hypothetical protein